jgi:hypothetical protein
MVHIRTGRAQAYRLLFRGGFWFFSRDMMILLLVGFECLGILPANDAMREID